MGVVNEDTEVNQSIDCRDNVKRARLEDISQGNEQNVPEVNGIERDENEFVDQWDPKNEYEEIASHCLAVEEASVSDLFPQAVPGNRIVNVHYAFNEFASISATHARKCAASFLQLTGEKRTGLESVLLFTCTTCDKRFEVSAVNPKKKLINKAAVYGTLTSGGTYGHTEEILSAMEVPMMNRNMFGNLEKELFDACDNEMKENFKCAGEEEKNIAINENRISKNGIPWITVCVDGGWSKRSYGHSYSALSGVGVIIGHNTRKVLHIGVRNKFCAVCTRASNNGTIPKPHKCFKNWSGSSSAMEADIIAEGFIDSVTTHGLEYKEFIADGDSSVYSNIRMKVPYGTEVAKIECTNHCIKNYGKNLHRLKQNKLVDIKIRKVLTLKKIKLLQKLAQNQIYHNSQKQNIEELKEDLLNSSSHVLGHHQHCKTYYCDSVGESPHQFQTDTVSQLLLHLKKEIELLTNKANRLIRNCNNNKAEHFMAMVNRFHLGKRINLVQRGSYELRAKLAALRYNEGICYHKSLWTRFSGEEPKEVFTKYINKMAADLNGARARRRLVVPTKKLPVVVEKTNNDYGPNIDNAMTDEEYETRKRDVLSGLQVTYDMRETISRQTTKQFEDPTYVEYRRNRLTASVFGKVIKRRETTSCHSLVQQILYKTNDDMGYCEPIQFGKTHEKDAVSKFEKELQLITTPAGLYIDIECGYLAASPDRLVDDDCLLEVKCCYTAASKKKSLLELAEDGKFYLKKTSNGNLELRRNHDYFYQVQGQLNIVGREICYFVVYVDDKQSLHIEKIQRDKELWHTKMKPALDRFYLECILREIVLQNCRVGKQCEDPEYIRNAQITKCKRKRQDN